MRFSLRQILFFTILLFPFQNVFGQDKVRLHQSLQQLKSVGEDTTKAMLLNNIGWDTSYDNLALGLNYCKQSLQLAEKLNFDRGKMFADNSLGTIYEDLGDYSEALDAHTKGLALAEKLNDTKVQGTINLNIALVYESMGDHLEELKHMRKAVDIY